ncbi:hypothetical protein F6R49_06695 [Staphylococcus aureus]|nr:hypothetical protein [Staphylococcus aureus]MBG1182558.1 hypothetical protein [Staphylococcus aureus]RQX33599.1 hypothetical protein DB791_01470 [Staphylococcus aureus]
MFKKLLLDNPIKKFFNSAIATPPNPCVYNKFSMKKIFEKAFSSKQLKIIMYNYTIIDVDFICI